MNYEVITKAEAKARGWRALTVPLKRSSREDNALFEDTLERVSADPTAEIASVENHLTRQLWRNRSPRHIDDMTKHAVRANVSAGPTIGRNQHRKK